MADRIDDDIKEVKQRTKSQNSLSNSRSLHQTPSKGSSIHEIESVKSPPKEDSQAEEPDKKFALAKRFPDHKAKTRSSKSYNEKQAVYDQYNPFNTKFVAHEEFEGPPKQRKFTDCICYLLFIVFVIALGASFVLSYRMGDVDMINYLDFRGRRCGRAELEDRPYVYYINPSLDMNLRMCVESCPDSTGLPICLYEPDGTTPTPFCYTQMNTLRSGSLCIPAEASTKRKFLESYFDTQRYMMSMVMELYYSWDFQSIALVVAVLLNFVLLELIKRKRIIKFIIWLFLFLLLASFLLLAYFFNREYKERIALRCLFGVDKYKCGGGIAYFFYYATFGSMGLAGLYLLVVVFLFNKINLVIALITTSLKITEKLSKARYLPLMFSVAVGGVSIAAVFQVIHVLTIGELVTVDAKDIDGGKVKIFQHDYAYTKFLPLVLGGVIYAFSWCIHVTQYLVGFMITIWFFYKKKNTINLPVSRVLGHTFARHAGSVALYTLIVIACFPLIKLCRGAARVARAAKFMQLVLRPLLFIYHAFTRYISKHFFIQSYLWNDSFWPACKKSYFLVKQRNEHRREGPNALYHFVLIQLKVSISLLMGLLFLSLVYFNSRTMAGFLTADMQLKYPACLYLMISVYFISSVFLDSFEYVNYTALQCNFIDEEMFVGVQRYSEDYVTDLVEFYADMDRKDIFIKAQENRLMGFEAVKAERVNIVDSQSSQEIKESDSDDSDSYEDAPGIKFKTKKAVNEERDFIEQLEDQLQPDDDLVIEEDGADNAETEEVMMFDEKEHLMRPDWRDIRDKDKAGSTLIENAKRVINLNNFTKYTDPEAYEGGLSNRSKSDNKKSSSNIQITNLSKEELKDKGDRSKSQEFKLNFGRIKEEDNDDTFN